jgi:hypothetical protein
MGFFILVCLFVIFATPLLMAFVKRSGQSGNGSGNFSDNDPNFYTSSASERYGSTQDSDNPDSGSPQDCNETGNDSDSGDSSDSDSGSCDSGSSD